MTPHVFLLGSALLKVITHAHMGPAATDQPRTASATSWRAERIVAQARENDARQLEEPGSFRAGCATVCFPLFVPFVARELGRQYAPVPGLSAEAM